MQSLREFVEETADELLAQAGSSFDLVADFASPLAVRVMGRLLEAAASI